MKHTHPGNPKTRRQRISTARSTPLVPLILAAISSAPLAKADEPDKMFRTAFPLSVLNNADPRDAKVAAQHLIKRIVEDEGLGYSTAVPARKEDFFRGLKNGDYDFFLIFTSDYLRLKDSIPMIPKLLGVHSDKETLDRFVFLTKSESFDGIHEGTLLVQKGAGDLPEIWLANQIAREDSRRRTSDHFEKIETVTNVSKAVLPVFFGKADACIVQKASFETITELNPQLGQVLTSHFVSEPVLISVLCLRAGYKEKTPGLVVDVGSNLHKYPDGDQILTLMRVNKLAKFEESFVRSAEKMMAEFKTRTEGASSLARTPESSDAD